MGQESIKAPDCRQVEDPTSRPDRPHHRQHKLHEIRQNHGTKPSQYAVCERDAARHQKGQPTGPPQQNSAQLDGSQTHRGHHEHVEHQPQVQRPEAAQKGRRASAVAQFVKADVCQHARAPPQPCIHEHRHHPRQQKRPPRPVACHPLLAHEVGDQVGGVCAEGRGNHADAKKPPRHVTSCEKIPRRISFRLTACPQSHPQRQGEIRHNEGPIQR